MNSNLTNTQLKISAVITCYREGELLREAVASLLQQTRLPQEIIIVNDASPDPATNQVCRELENHPLITVVWREKNGGPSVARNHGYQTAQGEILTPLDADDLLPPQALERIESAFAEDPQIAFVYGHYSRQDQAEQPPQIIQPGDISLARTLKARPFSLSANWRLLGAGPVRRFLWEKLEGYDPNFGVEDLHDLEFWLRAIAQGYAYRHIPETLYIWRKYLGGNTRQVTPLAWYRIARKYFDIYQAVGLAYRAYELLLLGAKWSDNPEEIRRYSHELRRCIFQGQFQLSSLVILFIPKQLLQPLAKRAIKRR
jgi:glycosyltransferase involved in cell wall biosynthesis